MEGQGSSRRVGHFNVVLSTDFLDRFREGWVETGRVGIRRGSGRRSVCWEG